MGPGRFAMVAALGVLGCAVSQNDPGALGGDACVPGQQVACACVDGSQGIQVCAGNGRSFTACECASAHPWNGGGDGASGGGPPATGGDAGSPSSGGADPGSGGSDGGASGGGWGGLGGWAGGSSGPVGDYAGGVQIDSIAIYQGVKVDLMKNGQAVTPNAPVVEGRPALVRVFVSPSAGFQSRTLAAALDLESANAAVESQTVSLAVSGPSSDSALGSTFNFTLPPEQVTADLAFAVSLHEPSGASVGAVQPGAVWPAQGKTPLGAKSSGTVHVTLVPFRYQADGSGRLPDTSNQQMQAYYQMLFALYPTSALDLQVRAPVDYGADVGPGWGWSEWLDTLCSLRQSDKVDSKVFYYGAMAPTPSWNEYGGGIAGLGNVPDANDDWGRCAVGLDFPQADPYGTIMAHEVGHTFGRPHAPCGVDGEPFPYPNASIGSWGYSLISGTLKDPSSYHDVMSYCDPQWISDVNFAKLFTRIQWVNQNYYVAKAEPHRYRKLLVEVDGSLVWGRSVSLRGEAPGTPRRVQLYDADGNAIGTTTAHFEPMSHEPAGALFLPELAADVAAVELDGFPLTHVPPTVR